jgi:hypothetical protein
MKVIWTDPSIEDLTSIRDYIARDSEFYTIDLIEQVICPSKDYYNSPGSEAWFLKLRMRTFENCFVETTGSSTALRPNESKSSPWSTAAKN